MCCTYASFTKEIACIGLWLAGRCDLTRRMNAEQSPTREFAGRTSVSGRLIEWPTVFVALGIFGSYALLTLNHRQIPAWVLIPVLGIVLTWSGSLQHETIHGHPTKWPLANELLGRISLDFWMPYDHYRTTHLMHHRDVYLTDPLLDPESYYLTAEKWAEFGSWRRLVFRFYRTMMGRLLLGPLFIIFRYLPTQAREVWSGKGIEGEGNPRLRWARQGVAIALTVAWLYWVGMNPWIYVGAIYVSNSGIRLRSFVEHRWMPDGQSKTATVHTIAPLSLLFLNNNLHTAHHARMTVPWYQLPEFNRSLDLDAVASAGAGLYPGYRKVARLYGVHQFDTPVFPGSAAEGVVPSRSVQSGLLSNTAT
jgi:fatty acid desaturase